MIFSLIIYGLLVLCILSWIQPQRQLKTKIIPEPNGRAPYQSRSCGVRKRTGKRIYAISRRRRSLAYPAFQQRLPADLIIQRVNSIWHSQRQRPRQNKKRRRKKTRRK